jgi:hypothetical protein
VLLGFLPGALDIAFGLPTIVIVATALGAQLILAQQVRAATAPCRWSMAMVVALLWVINFPLRLLLITLNQDDTSFHPLVQAAQPQDLVWVAATTTLALAVFALGVGRRPQRTLAEESKGRQLLSEPRVLRQLAIFGLAVTTALVLTGIESGLVKQIALVYLFGVAGLAFIGAHRQAILIQAMSFAAGAFVLGVLSGFKEDALLPLVAVALGLAAARKPGRLAIAALLITLSLSYAVVQGHRISGVEGKQESYLSSTVSVLFEHDLRTGLPTARHSAPEATLNLAGGVMRRFAGADSLLVLRATTPSRIPYQRGATLWQPAVSVVPGAERIFHLDFPTLSLGRFFAIEFYSLSASSDPSSQALTVPGDLYLNFGTVGIIAGMLIVGLFVGWLDRAWSTRTAAGTGALVYIGSSVAGIERNLSYEVVNTLIRVIVVLVIIRILTSVHKR